MTPFKFSNKRKWTNSIAIHLVIATLLWLPFSLILFLAAVDSEHLSIYLLAFSFSLISGLWLCNRVQTNLTFPTVEACEQHLILNLPVSQRKVYNLEQIEGPRFLRHILYFRHNGWPVLAPMPHMSKDQREQLLSILQRSKPSQSPL